jgi:hypothetical protein
MADVRKNLKVTTVGGEGFVSGEDLYINGRRVLNPSAIPREWTMGKICRRTVAGAQRDRWARVFFPITPEAAFNTLSPLTRAIILPDNVPFVLPRDNHVSAHILWRKATTYFELSALDDRTCIGLRLKEPRIFCHPPDGADVSKLLQLHAEAIVIMAPKDIAVLRDVNKVGVGCWEGWNSIGGYLPGHPHHPAPCALRDVSQRRVTKPQTPVLQPRRKLTAPHP